MPCCSHSRQPDAGKLTSAFFSNDETSELGEEALEGEEEGEREGNIKVLRRSLLLGSSWYSGMLRLFLPGLGPRRLKMYMY